MIEQLMSEEELTVISEWRVGGAILFRGCLHSQELENRGTIQQFEPEKILQYNYWSTLSRSRSADSPENYSVVRFDLTPQDGGTLLTLTQSDFPDPSICQHANLYRNGAPQTLKAVCERRLPLSS